MGKRNTFMGYLRVRGVGDRQGGLAASPVPLAASKKFAVADASVSTDTGIKLPQGAIVKMISMITGVTGGTAPTIDIGINFAGSATDDPDGLANDLAVGSNGVVDVTSGGVLFGEPLAEDGEITVAPGTGTPGTGGVDLIVDWTFDDDGKQQN